MISFNENSVFTLTPIDVDSVRSEVNGLLVDGERICSAFKTVRDQLVFTNKRIISVDVQGIIGKKKSFATLPYSKVQYFTIQTSGFLELVPDCELSLVFVNGHEVRFDFRGKVDIGEIGKSISEFVLA